jgi:hypothetical protein
LIEYGTVAYDGLALDSQIGFEYLLHLLRAAFGTFRSSQDVRLESAKWDKADIDQVAVTNPDFTSTRPRSRLFARAVGSLVRDTRANGACASFPTSWAGAPLFSNNLCSLRVFLSLTRSRHRPAVAAPNSPAPRSPDAGDVLSFG